MNDSTNISTHRFTGIHFERTVSLQQYAYFNALLYYRWLKIRYLSITKIIRKKREWTIPASAWAFCISVVENPVSRHEKK